MQLVTTGGSHWTQYGVVTMFTYLRTVINKCTNFQNDSTSNYDKYNYTQRKETSGCWFD